ncbi:MAG: family 43 glycosylhydrolase [Planctomycetaceae bacterium]
MHYPKHLLILLTLLASGGSTAIAEEEIFLLPYFLGNGEAGVYFAWSRDGLKFASLAGGEVIMPAPQWGDESLTRDPSIVYHAGEFHMVWTTSWNARSFGYAHSKNLRDWSEPRKIDIWGNYTKARNTWAPELHWDEERQEYLIIWSTTQPEELADGDGSEDPHGYDHRTWATTTKDFESFTQPRLFFSPENPEFSVIDPFIARDDRDTTDAADDRYIMVIKNELGIERGGKNLRLTFAEHMQGPWQTSLSDPIVGAGTSIVDVMGEGPTLFKRNNLWHLYWDAPESDYSYCLATSPDLKTWTNRSNELSLPIPHMRHGTVLPIPASAIEETMTEIP